MGLTGWREVSEAGRLDMFAGGAFVSTQPLLGLIGAPATRRWRRHRVA